MSCSIESGLLVSTRCVGSKLLILLLLLLGACIASISASVVVDWLLNVVLLYLRLVILRHGEIAVVRGGGKSVLLLRGWRNEWS